MHHLWLREVNATNVKASIHRLTSYVSAACYAVKAVIQGVALRRSLFLQLVRAPDLTASGGWKAAAGFGLVRLLSRRPTFRSYCIFPQVSKRSGNIAALAAPFVPVQRTPFALARPNEPLFTRWIEA